MGYCLEVLGLGEEFRSRQSVEGKFFALGGSAEANLSIRLDDLLRYRDGSGKKVPYFVP